MSRSAFSVISASVAPWPASFPRMHEGEDAYYISDTSHAELAETLATTAPPLLTSSMQFPSLTQDGRDVLEGRADRVVLCGIDRWFGGVHLQGHSVPWRWDGERGRVVSG